MRPFFSGSPSPHMFTTMLGVATLFPQIVTATQGHQHKYRTISFFNYPVLRIPGCLSRIPDPNFSIPDPGPEFFSIPDPGSASKNLSILTPKNGF
jgi:hypothetical protein